MEIGGERWRLGEIGGDWVRLGEIGLDWGITMEIERWSFGFIVFLALRLRVFCG